DFRLEVLDEAFLRRFARRLRAQRRAALADRLIDHGEVLLQRRGRARVERALFGLRNLLEARDRLGVVSSSGAQLALPRPRRIATRRDRRARSRSQRVRGCAPAGAELEAD